MSDQYDTSSETAQSLLSFLSIADESAYEEDEEEEDDDTYLTDSQKEKIEFANKLKAMGISEEDLEDFQEFKRQKEARKRAEELQCAAGGETEHPGGSGETTGGYSGSDGSDEDDYLDDLDDGEEDEDKDKPSSGTEKRKLDKTTSRVVKDIVQRTKDKPSGKAPDKQTADDDLDVDQDEYTRAPIDYSKRIEKAKQKSAAEIEKIAYFEELQARATEASKYSYGWFKALLELESINSGEANANSKEVSISFAKVEREPGTTRKPNW